MRTKELENILIAEFGPKASTPELSKKLKISLTTIYKLIKEGKLILVEPGKVDSLSIFNCIF